MARQLYLPLSQRWRERRDTYRPAGETIRTAEYEVAPILDDTTAKQFVVRHHYASSFPAARFRYGLFHRDALVGVAVMSHPAANRVLTSVFPGKATDSVELGRFVLLDEVPANGETWFLGRTFELLRREGIIGVLSFSDPMPRTTLEGRTVFLGHVGVVYQAHNATYLGRGTARTIRLLPDGTVLSDRAISKIRSGECGWRYSARLLERHGAKPYAGGSRRAWLARWMKRLTRRFRHPGNHKYAWPINRRIRRYLPPSQPYPKRQFDIPAV